MADMEVLEGDGLYTQVTLTGRLDTEGVEAIETAFTAHTCARGLPTIVDLTRVTYVASLGMGMFIRAAKTLKRHQAGMVLLGPCEPVARVLRAAQVDEVIPIVGGRDEALGALHVE